MKGKALFIKGRLSMNQELWIWLKQQVRFQLILILLVMVCTSLPILNILNV